MLTPQQLRIRQLNRRVYLSVATIILTVIAFFAIKAFIERPTDLGPKLEYIGTNYNSGCTLFFCDSPSSTTYYFATDMTSDEMKSYFVGANYEYTPADGGGTDVNYTFISLNFNLKSAANKGFTFYYYDNTQGVLKDYNLRQTPKAYVVSISADEYKLAQSAFKK